MPYYNVCILALSRYFRPAPPSPYEGLTTNTTRLTGEPVMKCPIDEETLVMTERNGVEIDYCPKCRGVWLDRGELDKIIERSDTGPAAASASGRLEERRDDRGYDQGRKPQRKKKESFLSELFDF